MPVRQHDRVDDAEIDPQDPGVALEGRALRPRVEQQRARLPVHVRGDQQRQPVVRAADRPARDDVHAPAGDQPGPLRDHVARRARQAVGDVVHQHQDVESVYGDDFGHGRALR